MARPRKMISLEEQIKKQEETVLKVKEKYDSDKLDWTVLMRKGQFECYFFRKFTIHLKHSEMVVCPLFYILETFYRLKWRPLSCTPPMKITNICLTN